MKKQNQKFKEILLHEKGERIRKFDTNKKNILLVSLSDYKPMMQNMGLQTLLHKINEEDDLTVSRSFIFSQDPSEETESTLSLDSQKNVRDYDLIGISIANPLQMTNLFDWLKLSEIPILREERSSNLPLIVAGGMGISNPEPFRNFIDMFFMGDSQQEFINFSKSLDKNNLRHLSKNVLNIPGVYVPKKIKNLVEPLIKNDIECKRSIKFTLEEAALILDKGCKFGCDFCEYFYNTGRGYFPYKMNNLIDEVNFLANQGVKRINIYSASSGNYPNLTEMMDHIESKGMEVGLLDTRLEQMNKELLKRFSKKSMLPLNLDAPSDRIRKIVKRTALKDTDFLNIIRTAKEDYNINKFSLYYIINYPGETEKDRENISRLVNKALSYDALVDLIIFPLFPSPNTPLQKAEMQLPHITQMRIQRISDKIYSEGKTRKNIEYPVAGTHQSFIDHGRLKIQSVPLVDQLIEGLTLRGDQHSGEIVFDLWKNGLLRSDEAYNKTITYLDNNHPEWESYFSEQSMKQIPWIKVAPKDVQKYCNKRYTQLKKKLILKS